MISFLWKFTFYLFVLVDGHCKRKLASTYPYDSYLLIIRRLRDYSYISSREMFSNPLQAYRLQSEYSQSASRASQNEHIT